MLVLALCTYSLIDDIPYFPGLLGSARAALGVTFMALVVSLPLMAGVAAADAVVIMRGRNRVIDSLPPGARNRFLLGRVGLLWGGAATGIAMACGVACVATAQSGGSITAMAFVLVPYALIGLAAYACIGYAVGYWWRSWLAPLVLIVCTYVLGITYEEEFIFAYNGIPPPWSGYQHPDAVSYGIVLAALASLAALGVVWLLALRTKVWKVVACAASVACIGGLIVGGLAFDSRPGDGWVDDSNAGWSCHALKGGTEVCVPEQMSGDLALVSAQLEPLVPQLLELDPALADAKWFPDSMTQGELSYRLPMGHDVSSFRQAQAAGFGFGLSCYEKWEATTDDTKEQVIEQLDRDAWILSVWIAGSTVDTKELLELGGPTSVSLSAAKTVYTRLVGCTY